jgi:hypothetical protein
MELYIKKDIIPKKLLFGELAIARRFYIAND